MKYLLPFIVLLALTFAPRWWLSHEENFGGTTTISTIATSTFSGPLGVGTSTPKAFLAVQGSTAFQTPLLFLVASSSPTATTSVFSIDNAGHVSIPGPSPTISACGTNPSVIGSDTAGTITAGTGTVTSCLLTFTAAYSAPPVCFANVKSVGLLIRPESATQSVTFTAASTFATEKIDYFCLAK